MTKQFLCIQFPSVTLIIGVQAVTPPHFWGAQNSSEVFADKFEISSNSESTFWASIKLTLITAARRLGSPRARNSRAMTRENSSRGRTGGFFHFFVSVIFPAPSAPSSDLKTWLARFENGAIVPPQEESILIRFHGRRWAGR